MLQPARRRRFTLTGPRWFLSELLGLTADLFDDAQALPQALSLYVPEGRQTIRPTLALKRLEPGGSGAFLVEACRYLADQLVAAWTREGKLEQIAEQAPNEEPTLYARRLVAQRCLYGVDKNEAAVELAKLSLWLVTLAKDLPFTFLDHALRHGDSLVGLNTCASTKSA